uniref:AB hydrolase-1 domain-containing protein n=1 Tax=Kalanchoe fedtschenkoi TaxID=63787 RepID=A0A7N0T5Z0_KALFE
MGNAVTCFSPLPSKNGRAATLFARSASKKSRDGGRGAQLSDEVIRRHAVAAALLFQQHQKNGSLRSFTRSASVSETGVERVKKQSSFTRSSSTRPASDSDSLTRPHQLVNQDGDRRVRGRFVLVHGGGFGAWCWYKTMALLQDDGFQVTAVDLAGSGVNSADPNSISSLVEYVKPLLDVLTQVEDGGKVILVGHDLGGACVSYAMEALPEKVAKAVFVAAAMVADGQSCLDVFSMQVYQIPHFLKFIIFILSTNARYMINNFSFKSII